ncbi:Peroxidase [Mycena sanguinolenta]|uniref:Peroxidase n=1 Tax=Mycena sanguinolenta TaxID=230812 RepID=A0A8H6XLB2_9AGAR|nr:Peroxidase [Mycena sanguinolenta]
MRRRSWGLICLASAVHLALADSAAVFNWPDPLLDSLDDTLYRQAFALVSLLATDCAPRDDTTVAAQWLRLAYHDTATHNSTTGTGGLDASIAFEFTRSQDVGLGMLESLQDFLGPQNEYVGMADIIAIGAVNAVAGCGGPVIPFRGGRIDATEAGPATVPEPQQDLDSHIASFKAQGFNETEMIALVACGHSLGGVRQVDFPLIVTEDVPNGIQTFASTVGFDNTIVHEYLNGTTENVLVVGSNITTRSDLRIFSSDGNATMQSENLHSLASPDTFNQVCADLIERMINTVPSTVTLTDPIEPFDFKVWNTILFPRSGSLAFLATLRIIHSDLNRTVTMFWKERTGTFCPEAGCSAPAFQVTSAGASSLANLKGVESFDLHSFNASIDLATSISHFWFEVDDNDGSAPFIVDNHGANFTIEQDVLLFDPQRSGLNLTTFEFTMVVGVKDAPTSTSVTGSSTIIDDNAVIPLPSTLNFTFTLDESHPPADGYTFYTSPISRLAFHSMICATVNGTAYSLWVPFTSATGL